jgi:hypothetical protein
LYKPVFLSAYLISYNILTKLNNCLSFGFWREMMSSVFGLFNRSILVAKPYRLNINSSFLVHWGFLS